VVNGIPYPLRPELATPAEAASLAMTRISAATTAWLSGVAVAEAEIEMAVDDILGVVIEALVETGADETAGEETADEEVALEARDEEAWLLETGVDESAEDETSDEDVALETEDEADELAEELPEYETEELEAEPNETDDDPLWVWMEEETDETATVTEPEVDSDGIAPDEVKVTKVDVVEVLGTTVLDELPIGVEDRDTETETEVVNECVEVASVVELTPTELLGVLEGVETGG